MNVLAPRDSRPALTLVGLVLTLLVMNVIVAIHASDWLGRRSGINPILYGAVLEWIVILIVLVFLVLVERRPLRSIGFRLPNWKTVLSGVVGGIVMVVGIGSIVGYLFPRLHLTFNAGANAKLLALSFWQRFVVVVTAAVGEEVLFRGYPIERIQELTGSRWLAGGVSLAAFTFAHLGYWGWPQLIIAGFGGLVLTLLYVWRRNLPANMLAHFIADGAGLLLR